MLILGSNELCSQTMCAKLQHIQREGEHQPRRCPPRPEHARKRETGRRGGRPASKTTGAARVACVKQSRMSRMSRMSRRPRRPPLPHRRCACRSPCRPRGPPPGPAGSRLVCPGTSSSSEASRSESLSPCSSSSSCSASGWAAPRSCPAQAVVRHVDVQRAAPGRRREDERD